MPKYEYPKPTKPTGKIRECLVSQRNVCVRYDRPINCAEETMIYPSGAKRCPSFKEADIDILNQFSTPEGEHYTMTWNRDKRKYVIYQNNKALISYQMDSLSYAYKTFFSMKEELQGTTTL